ncbi:thioredoxin M3, chloroplastic-like [Macadamia integrifolia]|uniref:thioredoxin M3, chloroplastic-like n=1 Tax=Macadamia integrifolia TaxID=60698 RepID=UPI001C4EF6A5|nr:thioredoxin M3, chloroplastic-like [Macadamia integrifolia]
MAVVFCGPRSLSYSRFMAKHACSSLPFQWHRTHLNCTATMHWKARSGIRVQTLNFSLPDHKDFPRSIQAIRDYDAPIVNGDSWDEFIVSSDTPILVEFFAPWCGPCRMVHRVIEEIAREYAGRLKCFILNTDQDLEIADKYGIDSVPVVLLFKDGEKQQSLVGTLHKEHYVAAIEKLLIS